MDKQCPECQGPVFQNNKEWGCPKCLKYFKAGEFASKTIAEGADTANKGLEAVRPNLLEKFSQYHGDNPHVYDEFIRLAKDLIGKGVARTSAWLIVNTIRWNRMISTKSDDFKISNDYIALYARKAMAEYPELDGLFETKEMKRTA